MFETKVFTLSVVVLTIVSTGCSSQSSSAPSQPKCRGPGDYTFSLSYDTDASRGSCSPDFSGTTMVLHYGGPTDLDAAAAVQTRPEGGIPPGATTSTVDFTVSGTKMTTTRSTRSSRTAWAHTT